MDYVIETRQLTKRFGELKAVDDLSIAVKPGEIFGLLANGRWKDNHYLDALSYSQSPVRAVRK